MTTVGYKNERHNYAAFAVGDSVKRAAFTLLLFGALPTLAAEKWVDAYNRGVNQVRTSSFQTGAESLQHAIEEMPEENAAQQIPGLVFTYVPHFWLGIAKLNLGDPDGALNEWKISEEQGAIQNTPYYAQLRDLISRANSERQRHAEGAATTARQEANGVIGRALSAQMDAVLAGGDRNDTYHSAQRKLAEAKDTNAKAGIDVRGYKRAADLAEEARSLFATAADDAKKQRASRPVNPNPLPRRKPAPGEILIPFDDLPQPEQTIQPQPPASIMPTVPSPQPAAESEALVATRIAAQNDRRKHLARTVTATTRTTSTTGTTRTTTAGQTPEQQLNADIDRRFRELNPGEMLINAPHEMRVGMAERFVLRIASVGQNKGITADLPAGAQNATSEVHVTPTMRAKLSGNGFVIEKTSPEEQIIGGGTFTEWLWQVTPTDSGDHELVANVQVVLDGRPKAFPAKFWLVHVKPNVIRSTKLFIKSNWQWLLTAMIIPLAGFLWRQRKKKAA